MTSRRLFFTLTVLSLTLFCASAGWAQTALTFDKSFAPSTIGPGGVSMLSFNLVNNTGGAAADVAFTDTLPAAMTIATPASPTSNCGGTLSAPDGGGVIGLSGGQIAASGSCSISVNVTSATAGTHTNTTSALTANIGSGGPASADLSVTSNRPGFSKAFAPATVGFRGRSTLTFTIDNSANTAQALNLAFVDNLPPDMVVADPANASSDCVFGSFVGSSITAVPGSDVVSLNFGGGLATWAVAAGASCTVQVDVLGNAIGSLDNVSGELTSSATGGSSDSSGKAGATLTVTAQAIAIDKSFTNDPAAPGGTVDLEFTIFNLARLDSATNITFTNDLDAVISGLAAIDLPANDVCGTGSQLSGTGVLSLTGGEIPAEGTCTFSVTLQVPAGTATGAFTNTTSAISAEVLGDTIIGDAASDVLFVEPSPILAKEFLDAATLDPDPLVGSGDDVVLRFTVTNTSPTDGATDVAFIDELTTFLPFPISATLPGADPCGTGSALGLVSLGTERQGLSLTGGDLAAGASCTFDVTLDVPVGLAPGLYVNTTEPVTGTVAGAALVGNSASDDFGVLAPPALTKEFIDDPAPAGGTVTLEFTISYDENGNGDLDALAEATDITFMDDLAAALAGLTATGLPAADVCGAGSSLTGTSTITLTGGSLTLGGSCTFSVTLDLPSTAAAGTYTNTTSNIQATVLGVATMGNQASDGLRVAGLELTKEFIDDPVIAGGTVDLRFTIDNLSPSEDATNIFFSDNLDEVLDGLVATGLPAADVCGTGSSLSGLAGNTLLQLTGGSLSAGDSCTFDVTLSVPANAVSDDYSNLTSGVTATIDGSTVAFDPAADELTVSSDFLTLAKEFTDDPVAPGATVNLRFTLENLSPTAALADVAFSDDLAAALTGLVATGLPVAACGGTASGTDTIDFSGGGLAAGETCSFDVAVSVPSAIEAGTAVVNVTSSVGATSGGLPVTGDPASDELDIAFVEFGKTFDGPVLPGGVATLTFNIDNAGTINIAELSFSDDLEAVLSGLTATGLPAVDVCGAGSELSEAGGVISLTGGTVLAGGSCTFSVALDVPAGAAPGDYLNTTSDLRQPGGDVAAAATAILTVSAPVDSDGDGVLDADDECPGTVIPEGVPTEGLGNNRYALTTKNVPDPLTFEYGGGPGPTLTTGDTAGCSCEQIIVELGLGQGHVKFGCSKGVMEDWIDIVSGGGGGTSSVTAHGRGVRHFRREPVYEGTGNGLLISVLGVGGTVTSGPIELPDGRVVRSMTCGGECDKSLPAGAVVKLMARPHGESFEFLGWGGDCSGSEQIITVSVDRATRCTAEFARRPGR